MQVHPAAKELRDGREQVRVVDAVPHETQREVFEEGKSVEVIPERDRRCAFQYTFQSERFELVTVVEDVCESGRVGGERAKEVEVCEVADGYAFGWECPFGVVESEGAEA